MDQAENSNSVNIRPLGGVNERVSPVDLPPSEFSQLRGLFPRQNGLLERFWGNEFLYKFPEAVLSINPTHNSSGHILIQTATKRYLTTLDELLGRNTYITDLTPATSTPGNEIVEEESMSLAIIIGKKAAGVTGKVIGTAYADRDLSDIHVNEGGIVTALAANLFTLAAGTYRIEVKCCHCNTVTKGNQSLFIDTLYNNTNSDYLLKVVGVVSAASVAIRASSPARTDNIINNIWGFLEGTFTLTSSCDISVRSKVNVAAPVTDGATPVEGKPVNMGESEVYTIVKILKTA